MVCSKQVAIRKTLFLAFSLSVSVIRSAEAQVYKYGAVTVSASNPESVGIGAIVGLNQFHGVWGLEGEYSVATERGNASEVARHLVFARAMLLVPVRGMGIQLRPFVDAGPLIAINPSSASTETAGGWHAGAGGVFAPGRHLGARAAVEWVAPHSDSISHSWRFSAGVVVPFR
jgi:hypothetical protein